MALIQKRSLDKKFHLTGYFDSNFGDDMMMKLVVRSLPEFTFVVNETKTTPIFAEPNVIGESYEQCEKLPKLVVIGSGFMINSKNTLIVEAKWFIKGYHAGDYCLGCNIEPLDTPLKRFFISRKLNKFKLITCRDQASYRWLRENTKRPEIHYQSDILFSIPDEWLPEIKSPDKLGISLMHRVGDQEDCAYYRAMAEAADEWIATTGKGVILMAFDTGKEDDLTACRAVISLMQHPEHAEIVGHSDCTEMPTAFSRCEKIICARLHATVLALRMGIPAFPLIFREKARNLLNDLKYPYATCNIDNIDMTALRTFLTEDQVPYHFTKDLYESAKEHVRIFKTFTSRV